MDEYDQDIQNQQTAMFHAEGLSQGRIARLNDQSLKASNPYDYQLDEWMHDSFVAGWYEADSALKNGEVN